MSHSSQCNALCFGLWLRSFCLYLLLYTYNIYKIVPVWPVACLFVCLFDGFSRVEFSEVWSYCGASGLMLWLLILMEGSLMVSGGEEINVTLVSNK